MTTEKPSAPFLSIEYKINIARKYALKGWPVHPLNGKKPIIAGWPTEAPSDLNQVELLLKRYPGANIGVVTGRRSDVLVLDVDKKNGGLETLAELERRHEPLPRTLTQKTGGGGLQFFFNMPSIAVKSLTGVFKGIDVRADGGQVVVPPSIHPETGRAYSWLSDFDSEPLADVPSWLLSVILAGKKGDAQTSELQSEFIGEGQRHTHLVSLAGALRRQGCDSDMIVYTLHGENEARCRPPLPAEEVERIGRSVAEYDAESILVRAPYTDFGNAERFSDFARYHFRFVPEWKKWITWNGYHWAVDRENRVRVTARDMARLVFSLADKIVDSDIRKAYLSNARKCESDKGIKSLLGLAEPLLTVSAAALDANPRLLNCRNGTLDLATGELRPHNSADFITRMANLYYDPAATCPQWLAFLEVIMGGNLALIAYLQRALGYSLTGLTSEQCLFLLHGTGANGKSTLIEVVRGIIGEYGRQTEFSTFIERKNPSVRNDIARLQGARFVAASEVGESKWLDEALVKQVTGGDTISARYLYGEYFEFVPMFKIWLAANHKPQIRGTDNGIWRRIHLIPFNVTIPPEQRDKNLVAKLMTEASGILLWMANGCREWYRAGLQMPAEVEGATKDYRDEEDTVAQFIADHCIVEPNAFVGVTPMFAEYIKWCDSTSQRPLSAREFGDRLTQRSFQKKKTKSHRQWVGIGLRANEVTEGGARGGKIGLVPTVFQDSSIDKKPF